MQLCQIKEKSFKKYCNKIVGLVKIKNQNTRNFLKKTREIPKLYGKGFIILYILKSVIELALPLYCLSEENTVTDSQDISEHFSNFFPSLGQFLQKISFQSKCTFQII